MTKGTVLILFFFALPYCAYAQHSLLDGMEYSIASQGSFSHGKTPLWLNANKYGLSSLEESNGYIRGSVQRGISNDSTRKWGIGYGIDIAATTHYTSHMILQQAFAEFRWLKGLLTVGNKQHPMELKNNNLSSGSQTFGINARPIPEIRLSLPEYWNIPGTRQWLKIKGHIAYGCYTDGNWESDFTLQETKYSKNILLHTKSGYLKVGKEESFPLTIEMGLEMATQFGGKTYFPDGTTMRGGQKISDFWKVIWGKGGDPSDGAYNNAEGNALGSWVFRLNWDQPSWQFSLYGDHYFEDHSQMFFLDYDGYGSGDAWNKKEKKHYIHYRLKDIMLGTELTLKRGTWIKHAVLEYITTKDQSGAMYHDHGTLVSYHVSGNDNYYNHGVYPGWEHWGQVIGNPLYFSPIYNTDHQLKVKDNRFMAWHFGIDGSILSRIGYRLLATHRKGWGTYEDPFVKKKYDTSFLAELIYHFHHGWTLQGAFGLDHGSSLGNNHGLQITISKTGLLSR